MRNSAAADYKGSLNAGAKSRDPSKRSGPNIKTPEDLLHPRTKLVVDALTLAETQSALTAMIRTLEHKQREVLLLWFFGGLKLTEIAPSSRLGEVYAIRNLILLKLAKACREHPKIGQELVNMVFEVLRRMRGKRRSA